LIFIGIKRIMNLIALHKLINIMILICNSYQNVIITFMVRIYDKSSRKIDWLKHSLSLLEIVYVVNIKCAHLLIIYSITIHVKT